MEYPEGSEERAELMNVIRQKALYALIEMLHDPVHVSEATRHGLVASLNARCLDPNPCSREYAVIALGMVSEHHLGLQQLYADGSVAVLCGMMNDQDHVTRCNVFLSLLKVAVGLDPEFTTHNRLADLSGGQKVKVVLAACTWAQPHLIILDEPTNYLDRDSLGALAGAIKEFGGGVLLITHNQEFADVTCKVTWVVANNRLIINGDAEWEKYAAEAEILQAEEAADGEQRDSHGNIIKKVFKAKPVEELTTKEIKKFKKSIRNKIKKNSQLEEWEEEYAVQWDLLAA